MADSADAATEPPAAPPSKNPLRRIYHWILSWANHPWGSAALALFAFLDSSVFPIPPLFLQVALSLEKPRRSFWYAFIDTAASVMGAMLGYYIGYALWGTVGVRIVGDLPQEIRQKLGENAFEITFIYSFIPLPYKLITIGSGFLHLNLLTLLVASTLGRSLRFFGLGLLCYVYGPRARGFIERHFNTVCLAIGLLGATFLLVIKVVWKH